MTSTDDTHDDDRFVPVADEASLEASGRELVTPGGTAIALFHHEGEIRAVDNRCPHMGFPLSDGTVEDGILTCHWHHARFELSCGDTFDPWADDVLTYPVTVHDGTVYVDPNPPLDQPSDELWAERLNRGLEENLRLVVAKSTIGLLDADVPYQDVMDSTFAFGTRYREMGWSSGLTILACMANVFDELDLADQKRAMYTGIRHVANDCAGEAPNFDQPAFSTTAVSFDRLKSWFRNCVEVRDSDGAERCLRTAIAAGMNDGQLAEIVFSAATDHPYLTTGHVFDFANKAFESLDHVGWTDEERTGDVLASLVTPMTTATRSDELSSWCQPIDLVALLEDVYGGDVSATSGIEALVNEASSPSSHPPDGLHDVLLDDDPEAIITAITDAIRSGTSAEALSTVVSRAAATRVAQFGTANEFSDWNTVHHTFTYANAVNAATRRTDAIELYRGVFDAAINIYLNRFLNTPPAPVPEPGEYATGRTPEDICNDVLAIFDEEGAVNEAGRLVAEYFDCGGSVADLKRTVGHGLLREDAGFHTLQNVEAAFRQYDIAITDGRVSEADRRLPLIATVRYLAAHFPTRREAEQTFSIARRLNRGEAIHEGD